MPVKNALLPPHLDCVADCVAPNAVIVFVVADASMNVLPVPSIGSSSETLLKKGSPDVGVTAVDAVEYAPVPTPFTAATRNCTAVPLVSEVTTWLAVVDAVRETVVHDEPELLLNCTT